MCSTTKGRWVAGASAKVLVTVSRAVEAAAGVGASLDPDMSSTDNCGHAAGTSARVSIAFPRIVKAEDFMQQVRYRSKQETCHSTPIH